MCGITGLWSLDGQPLDRRALERFTDSQAHRGPDGRGFFVDGKAGLGLGHRRLAILDVSERGAQPMSTPEGRYTIVYNGEIYNFIELRSELEGLGHSFETGTDTEVALAAYVQWGETCFTRFNGMWAIAIWDNLERTLLLCRDRFGVKPLHYWCDGQRFAFASEMQAFLHLDGFSPEVDAGNMGLAISRPSFFEGTTLCLLRGVNRLTGGYLLRVSADGTIKQRRWWNTLDHLHAPAASYEEAVEEFYALFMDACRIRMRSDVPLATSLSGGLDSSSVLAAVYSLGSQGGERMAPGWQKAFVAAYPGTSHDEREYADIMVEHTGADPVHFSITPDTLVEHMEAVVAQYGELSDIHVGPWLAYKRQRENGTTVSLDGHGGDEMLAGYHKYHHYLMMDASDGEEFAGHAASLMAMYEDGHPSYIPTAEEIARRRKAAGGAVINELYPAPDKRVHPHPRLRVKAATPVLPQLEEDAGRLEGRDSLFTALYVDYHCLELPTNLRNYDRLSMAHGVEVRSPFCDYRLACQVFSQPSSFKVGGGYAKRLLRGATRNLLPDSIRLRRTKVGFANPRAEWREKLKPLVMDVVASSDFRQSDIWDGDSIFQAVEEGYAHGRNIDVDRAWIFIHAHILSKTLRAM